VNQNQISLLSQFGSSLERVERAIISIQQGHGVLLLDDEFRENEGDLIYSVAHLTDQQMAFMIRSCSGIVCLCLTEEKADYLKLHPMVENNECVHQTAFTISIEARNGVTTGVSASDRVKTIQTACREGAQPNDLVKPGHVFPLRAQSGGVMSRRGHTEGTVDLMRLAGLAPEGILCEVTNDDGSMAKTEAIIAFAQMHQLPVLTVEDIVQYRQQLND
jgi:3,4-dihydroxy 2-butanone 4-phosphate synthase